ncbi:hypersensitive-induced response protein [Chrysochromulina tobinii]|uniref:Hypersensitive-induced response protein n=1 Tax=Chrysochromulina tobinii TaxID=1460289 RepID=A0A0M0J5Z0_9EUKA|nr:hypersensitive-induced response protein [Chrysochromulina tobinii]|eukprot:KOO21638.1 hypersensitive-induced response protein [Chrysochromulina sp. CCMP291]
MLRSSSSSASVSSGCLRTVFLTIRVAIQYQVIANDDAIKASYYRLTNPKQQVESYVYDVIRSTVPKINLDDVFTTKEEVAADILENLREAMKDFGYEILSTPITDIDPNREVKNAMNEINKQKRLRVAAEDEGEAGISRQRQAVMEGLRESCAAFHDEIKSIDPKTVLDLMVVTSYFDMMKDLGAHDKTSAVFMNHSPGALEDLAGAVSKGFMTGLPAAPGFAQPMGRR